MQTRAPMPLSICRMAYELIHRLNVPRVGAGPSGLGSVSSIGASRAYIDEVNQALAKLKMRAASFYAQPLAEGIFLLPKPVRSAIAVLLDVGYYNIGILYLSAMRWSIVRPCMWAGITLPTTWRRY